MIKNIPIRIKIAVSLILISLFTFVFVYINDTYQKGKIKLSQYQHHIEDTRTLIYKSLQLQGEFLLTDSRTNEFHIDKTCSSLSQFQTNLDSLMKLTADLQKAELTIKFELTDEIISLRDLINQHQQNLKSLQNKTLEKGFFNYGKEGELRSYIHRLEDEYSHIIPLNKILQLRRSEKDYMLRHNLLYFEKNQQIIRQIEQSLTRSKSDTEIALLLLASYQKTFKEYVALDTTIGFERKHGLRKDIDLNSKALLSHLDQISSISNDESKIYRAETNTLFLIYGFLFLMSLGYLIYYTARNLSKPILELSAGIYSFVHSDFQLKTSFTTENRKDEIGDLIRSFNVLQTEIADHFAAYKISASEKQKELEEQKEKIEIQKFLVLESRNNLNDQIQHYSDSLRYAGRIQKSILPKPDLLESILGSVGLYYRPKTLVSGDFYWAYENSKYQFAAVVDCTGHGVPGALMSILGISYLNYGVKDKAIKNTADLLNYLNTKVAEVLGQYGMQSEVKDGMDICLVRIDKKTGELQYSGAQRELLIIRDETLMRIAPDKFPIGWILPGAKKQFSYQNIQLQDQDLIAMYTDGAVDQFGGVKHKKFTRNQLYQLLLTNADLEAEHIAKTIETNLASWRGKYDQTDDICFLAFRHISKEFVSSTKKNLGVAAQQI